MVAGAGFEPTVRVGTKALPGILFVQSQVPAQPLRSLYPPPAALPCGPPFMIPPRHARRAHNPESNDADTPSEIKRKSTTLW